VVAGYLALYIAMGMSPAYIVPWLVFHAWLYTVTYLQHHNGEDTKVRGAVMAAYVRTRSCMCVLECVVLCACLCVVCVCKLVVCV
jgi:fatty acid desaturase